MTFARIALLFAGLFLFSVASAALLVALTLTDDGAWTRNQLEPQPDWRRIERSTIPTPSTSGSE